MSSTLRLRWPVVTDPTVYAVVRNSGHSARTGLGDPVASQRDHTGAPALVGRGGCECVRTG